MSRDYTWRASQTLNVQAVQQQIVYAANAFYKASVNPGKGVSEDI